MTDNLHLKVNWGPTQVEPRVLADDDTGYSLRPSATGTWRIVLSFGTETFGGVLLEDADGAVLCWNDYVVNEWTEIFSNTPAALMRLALLLDAVPRGGWFEEGASAFTQKATQFMHAQAPSMGS